MDILFLGDSLIEYYDWQGRFPGHKAVNLGMAGESVEGLLSRVMKIRDICPEADMIFIMTGINNVAMGDTEFIGFYRMIIEKLSSAYPDAKIFINSLLPTAVDFIQNDSVRGVNGSLKKLAEDTGAQYLDIYYLFVDEEGMAQGDYLSADGVHLSNRGYEVWSDELDGIINTVS